MTLAQIEPREKKLPLVGQHEAMWTPGHNPWLIAVAVTLATFMEVLDTSIANVALPHIAGNLSAGVDESTWVLTSYLVSNAIVLPLSGWLSGIFGRKRFYMTCVVMFTASSFLCGLAPNLEWLVFFRVLQGLGGGGLQPSEQAILVDTFPPAKRGMGMAVYGIAVVCRTDPGADAGGMDHGQLFLAVGILHQHSGGDFVADSDFATGERSALFEGQAEKRQIPHRLHRAGDDRAGAGNASGGAGQGAAGGLV